MTTHIVTLAGRDSNTGHRRFIPAGFVLGSGQGSVSERGLAGLYTEDEAECIADALAARTGYAVAWCAEPADATLDDW